jgi:hypothetical protein
MKAQPKQIELTTFTIDDTLYYVAPIENYTGYFASTCGYIVSDKNNEPKVLKGSDQGQGYLQVCISADGTNKLSKVRVHRLIAQTYYDFDVLDYGGRPRTEVNHLNGIRSDNRVTNLEHCSSKENMVHAHSVLKQMKALLAGETANAN